jgi:hypothetical protein
MVSPLLPVGESARRRSQEEVFDVESEVMKCRAGFGWVLSLDQC